MAEIQRRKTPTVKIGQVGVGWEVPVVVQSMTNTDTADIPGTIEQVAALALAGSEIVRVTVNNEEAAAAVPYIVEGSGFFVVDGDADDFGAGEGEGCDTVNNEEAAAAVPYIVEGLDK